MYEYHLELAGVYTVLRTPDALSISDRLRPFLCTPRNLPDCTVTVRPCSTLPAPSGGGVWNGPEYYDGNERAMRVFHCGAVHGSAFAVTQLDEDGNVEIAVLPGYLSYFAGSSGIFNRIGMETLLLRHHGVLLHASLIKYAHKGIAFTGPSGVGKSTQADIWKTHMGADILNGDRAALRKTDGRWIAYGSPYAGTSGIYRNDSAPLEAVIVLRQAKENRLRTLPAMEALRYIYPEVSVHQWDRHFVAGATDLCLELLSQVPVYLLECLPEEDAAVLLRRGLDL